MATNSSHNELASSLTDLMTSLAVIFVLLLVASLNNMQRKTQHTVNDILLALTQQLKEFGAMGVQVERDSKDPLGLLVLVPEGLLQFQTNDAVIPPKGHEFLAQFSPKLAKTACAPQFRDEINSIVIEGHADSSGDETINLPLSQRRSMAVVTETLDTLRVADQQAGSQELKGCFLKFVSASGRGSEDPVLTLAGLEDRDRSRRVIFKIRVRSVEQRQTFLTKLVG